MELSCSDWYEEAGVDSVLMQKGRVLTVPGGGGQREREAELAKRKSQWGMSLRELEVW